MSLALHTQEQEVRSRFVTKKGLASCSDSLAPSRGKVQLGRWIWSRRQYVSNWLSRREEEV